MHRLLPLAPLALLVGCAASSDVGSIARSDDLASERPSDPGDASDAAGGHAAPEGGDGDEGGGAGGAPDRGSAPMCAEFEQCDNGLDDDCDGAVDCDDDECDCGADQPDDGPGFDFCDYETIDCGIPNCNGHLGDDLDACMAAGNSGGCTDEELLAWCTRRVDPGPGGLWYEIHERWVADQCGEGGEVAFVDEDGRGVYACSDKDLCVRYECRTPLVLVFEPGRRVTFVPDDGRGRFDLSTAGDGTETRSDWPTADTPWLARDVDGDGRIGSARELFGSATALPEGGHARHGFAALSPLDADGDGDVDADDPGFAELLAWLDDGDRVSQPSELVPLARLGVTSLSLSYARAPRCDARGNCEIERAAMRYRDPSGERVGEVVDVHLRVRRGPAALAK